VTATLITDRDDPAREQHADQLQALQNDLGAIQNAYADSTLAFAALGLAWEAVRLAYYTVKYERPEHLAEVESALRWLKGEIEGA
jgi:hypothetical protein